MSHTAIAVVAFAALLLVNLLTFAAWGDDKRRAVHRLRRTPERKLLIFCGLGGWPAALIAARLYRHKTRKLSLMAPVYTIAAAHLVIAAALWIAWRPA